LRSEILRRLQRFLHLLGELVDAHALIVKNARLPAIAPIRHSEQSEESHSRSLEHTS